MSKLKNENKLTIIISLIFFGEPPAIIDAGKNIDETSSIKFNNKILVVSLKKFSVLIIQLSKVDLNPRKYIIRMGMKTMSDNISLITVVRGISNLSKRKKIQSSRIFANTADNDKIQRRVL